MANYFHNPDMGECDGGQLMATTSNYGWTTPDDTSYVKDGASAIRSLGSAVDAALYPVNYVATNAQTGTSYTLVLSDATKSVTMNNAASNTLTIPPNSSVAYPIGTQIVIGQLGAGQTTIVAGAGVTLRSYNSRLKLSGQYAVASVIKIATDTWLVAGNLTA